MEITIWFVPTAIIYSLGFIFFLLYWYGEEAKSENALSGAFITFFALLWPGVLLTNIGYQMCCGLALLFRSLSKILEVLGRKFYDKINGEGKE